MKKQPIDITGLSVDERLDLLDQVWESLSEQPTRIPLTDAQRAELDRRLDELEADPTGGIPWEEVFERIRARRS